MRDRRTAGTRRFFKALAAAAAAGLVFAGCGTAPESPAPSAPPASVSAPAPSSEPAPEPAQEPVSLAATLAEMFLEDWEKMDTAMMLPTVAVFQTQEIEGQGKAVFFVWPAYKNTAMEVFWVAGDTVTRLVGPAANIADCFVAGTDFELSSTDPGAVHTSWTLTGSSVGGDYIAEDSDLYLTVSPGGIEETLSISLYTVNDPQTASLYEDGERKELTMEEYQSIKAEADAGFADARTIHLDLLDFDGFDMESGEDFAAYIEQRLDLE